MIIPVQPVPVRISLETQAINNGGYVTHDIDVAKLINDAESVQYELNLCYGITSLYRSSVYHVNKYANTIAFYFMVNTDIFSATLSVANKRCTFAKIETGVSESAVRTIVNDATAALVSSGLSENITNIDGDDGVTLTVPSTSVITGLFVQGRLILADEVGNSYVSDFGYNRMSGFTLTPPPQGSVFSFTSKTNSGYNTGTFITCSTGTFSAYVLWYYNPDSCYITEGEFTPEG